MNTIFTPKIAYTPEKDEMMLEFCPIEGKMSMERGRFRLWRDEEGNICAIAITPFMEEMEEFEGRLNTIRLASVWKGIKITDEDIGQAREDLLKNLEEKW